MSIIDQFSLAGQVALVTGAGRGIGKGIALALAEAGADVVCAARTQAEVDEVAEAVRAMGRRALAVSCNVASSGERERLVDSCVAELGGLSILVNNAGGAGPNHPLKTTPEEFSSTLTWNVVPAFDLTRIAQPHLVSAGAGCVINISSAAGRLPQKNFSAYGAAKAALSHLTRMLAQDFAPAIRVNAIEPGPILTPALEQYLTGDARAHMEAGTPLGRLGRIDDVAAAALFLAAPASSWMTGKVIELDGGAVSAW